MPQGDKTGPLGMGPKTGRGLGICSEFGYKQQYTGLKGYFGGKCPQTKEEKKEALNNYRKALGIELENVKKLEEEIDN